MLSRVADSLYWMSRYLERAEHMTRLLDVNLNLMLDESGSSSDHRWQRLLEALGKPKKVVWGGNAYELAETLSFDTDYKSSVISCLTHARENARHVREQISTEQWHRLNSLYLEVTRPEVRSVMRMDSAMAASEAPSAFLQGVMETIHQFQGITDSTMSHGEGWHFIQVGRFLERATATALLLSAYDHDLWSQPEKAAEGNQYLEWMGLLRSCTAFEAYCKVYTADLTPERIVEFLLLDPEFPHSVRFSVESAERALDEIHRKAGGRLRGHRDHGEHLQRIVGRLSAQLGFASVEDVLNGGMVPFLQSIQQQGAAIHAAIHERYVDYPVQVALAR